MIESNTVQIYNWFDIQNEICRVMGIERDKFRNYGITQRDLWHVALDTVIPDQMANDTVVRMHGLYDDYDYIVEEQGEWTKPFFDVYQSVFKEIDPEDKGVWVKFSW